MLKLALRSVWARKFRLAMLGAIIMTSVGFITGTYMFTDSINQGFGDLFGTAYKDTSAVIRGQKISEDADDFTTGARNLVPQSVIDKAKTAPGVADVYGWVQGFASVLDKKGKSIELGPPTFISNWSDAALNPYKLVEGRAPKGGTEVVINRLLAKKGGYKVGEQVPVAVGDKPENYTVVGIASFGTSDGSTIDVMFELPTALKLIGQTDFTQGLVQAKPGVSHEAVRDAVRGVLDAKAFEVSTGDEVAKESSAEFKKLVDGIAKFLLAFGYIALLVGVFVIYNTFSILIAQRQREIALLRAVGATRRQVILSVLAESVVIGIIGSAIGLAFGMVMATGLKAVFAAFGSNPPGEGLIIQNRTLVIGLAVGIIATVLSAVFPAIKASSVPPVAAIRSAALDTTGNSRIRAIIGVVVVALGAVALAFGLTAKQKGVEIVGASFVLVIIGVAILGPVLVRPIMRVLGAPLPRLKGVTGELAQQNAIRNPRRTASSSLALTIGVAVVAFFLVLGSSIKASVNRLIDKQFTADYIVTSAARGNPAGLANALTEQVSKVPGVGLTTGLRFAGMAVDGKIKPVVGANPASVGDLFDFGQVDGKLADLTGESIAMKTSAATKAGLGLGSTINVRLETGEAALKIVALFEKNDAIEANYLMGIPTMTTRVPSASQDAAVVLKLEKGADQTKVRAALDAILKDYPTLKVQDRADFKASQSSAVNGLLIFVSIMLVLAILIALIGIVLTLLLSILERKRELGVLRAIGQQRRQSRSTVRWESVLIAVLGTLLGLVIGTGFGAAVVRANRSNGFNSVAIPIGSLVVVTLLGALAGILASVLPARRAAKTDIMAALAS